MRGQQIFQTLFNDSHPPLAKQEGKGRSPQLNAKRDELLVNRYFFYGAYTPYRYEKIIAELSSEFFLAERRITDIISSHSDILRKLRDDRPSPIALKKKYPHLVWQPIASPVVKKSPIQL